MNGVYVTPRPAAPMFAAAPSLAGLAAPPVTTVSAPVVDPAPAPAHTTSVWPTILVGVAALAAGIGLAYAVTRPAKSAKEIAHEELRNPHFTR
jgi:ABC-type Fe3+ transport system permease subunit